MFAKLLQDNGADVGKVDSILIEFYSFRVVMNSISKHARNPEWVAYKKWIETFGKKYKKAIKSLEILLNDSIPASTRETIIKKDLEMLKNHQEFVESIINLKITMKPKPTSIQQMLIFQSYALYEYLKKFKGEKNDKDLYNFIAELLQNFYKEPSLDYITGDILKKNFIDNAYKTRGKKYKELEETFKPFVSKTRR